MEALHTTGPGGEVQGLRAGIEEDSWLRTPGGQGLTCTCISTFHPRPWAGPRCTQKVRAER